MKIFGHPVHVLLIHFPSALLPMDLALCLLAKYYPQPYFVHAAFYCAGAGVGTGIFALLTGFIDMVMLDTDKKRHLDVVLVHGGINGTVICGYMVLAVKTWKTYPVLNEPSGTGVLIRGALILLLFLGNYFGGKLIYKYHIGLQK